MVNVAFGELRGEEVVLTDASGNELQGTARAVDVLFLSRLDCDIKCIEVPPVADHELPDLIRYRIRSVYPGNLENVAVDQIVQRRKGGQVAVVSIMDKAALEKYRRLAPRASLSLVSISLLSRPRSRTDGLVIHWSPKHAEVLSFKGGLLVGSTLLKRSRPASDTQRVMKLMDGAPRDHAPLFIAPQEELSSLQQQFSSLDLEARSTESMDFVRGRAPSLFRPEKKFRLPRPALTRSVLGIVIALLATGVFLKYLHVKETELGELRAAVVGSQASDKKQADLDAQYTALKTRVASLIQKRPMDVFQFLSDLRAELGPGASIQDIVLQNKAFQFQASGPNPLTSMRRFLADSRFGDVRLLQITPMPGTSRQRFIITGKYTR